MFAFRLHRNPRSGITLVIAALTTVLLLGMVALTVDVGRHTVAAQRAQIVADAGAVAAAKQLPDTSVADEYMQYIVQANNERMDWPEVTVNSDECIYYTPGQDVPGYGTLANDEYAVTVTSHVNDNFTFGKIFGQNVLHADRSATALATLGNQALPAIFSGRDVEWEDAFVSDGGGMYIDGAVHSNSGITFHGSHITITQLVEYRYNLTICGSDINLLGGSAIGEVLPYPVDHEWDDFTDWDYEVDGDWVISDSTYEFGHVHVTGDLTVNTANFVGYNGILVVDGNVDFQGHGTELQNVTVVAKGDVTFSGSCSELTPYYEDLAVMSLATSSTAIRFDGAGQGTTGTLFSPNGTTIFHGANSHTHNGSIIGDVIQMKGGHYTLTGTEQSGTGDAQVRLIQ